MKILFDYQAFYMQRFGGISNCYTQLIKKLPEDVKYKIAINESDNVHLKESGLINVPSTCNNEKDFLYGYNCPGKHKIYEAYGCLFPSRTSLGRNRRCSIDAIKENDFDIFHPTYFDDYFLKYIGEKPYVLTIYDMISEIFWGSKSMQTANKRKLAESAAHIVAISEKTKEDIMDILHVPEAKISVMYLAASEVSNVIKEPIVKGRYILYVGIRKGYKNFSRMITELLPFLSKNRDVKVVCTGNDFSDLEILQFKRYGISDQLIHLRPSDIELRNLYFNALCFIYPSMYEGFGIPILEAWQSNCPVLLNKTSCFPEIAQDAAIYFHLDDNSSDLLEVLEGFMDMNREQKRELIIKQRQRLEYFSWEKSACRLTDIYEKVLNG